MKTAFRIRFHLASTITNFGNKEATRHVTAPLSSLTFNGLVNVLGIHNHNMLWILVFLLGAIFAFLFAINGRQLHLLLFFLFHVFLAAFLAIWAVLRFTGSKKEM